MSVTDFECAIARSQINRYVAGDALAGDVIQQLEAHLGMCSKCKKVLEEKKASLMAMLTAPETVEQRPLSLPEEPVTMAAPYSAPIENLDTKQKLRQQLEERQRVVATQTNTETVAAFAYHDPNEVVETPAPKQNKFLSAFALFKKVEDTDEPAPKLTRENLTAAKQQLSKQKGGFTKPMVYMVGLIAVAGAMAFFLKDPTALFGAKATSPDLLVRKADTPAEKQPVKKVRRSTEKNKVAENWKKVRADKTNTASQTFAPTTEAKATPIKPKVAEKVASVKPKVAVKATVNKPKSTKRTSKPTLRIKPKAQTFASTVVEKPKTKKSTKTRSTTTKVTRPKTTTKPKTTPPSDEGSIKIYEPEGDR